MSIDEKTEKLLEAYYERGRKDGFWWGMFCAAIFAAVALGIWRQLQQP